jgi:hypothetical protein
MSFDEPVFSKLTNNTGIVIGKELTLTEERLSKMYNNYLNFTLIHYIETVDYDTKETVWKKYNRQPKAADLYRANNVIRKNKDGTYEYVKNRATGELRLLNEEEIMWLILKAGE